MASVVNKIVESDEDGMRLDRWFKTHYSGLGFGQLQKLLRSGQIRVDGKRAKSDTRITKDQSIRIPPNVSGLSDDVIGGGKLTSNTIRDKHDEEVLKAMLIYEDPKLFVFNKPAGLAVQGGSGVSRHVDKMLESLRNKKGEKPRLVHRLDRDTSGVLVVARTKGAAAELTKAFRHRNTDKIYWALLRGVPSPYVGKISTWMVKERTPDGDKMRVCKHGVPDAVHAVTQYRVIEKAGNNLSWVEFQPVTGRTHQLRVHASHIDNPIIGDPKYFDVENWQLPGGIQKKLHLHASRIRIPHPSNEGLLDVTAPLPPHMVQSWNLLGFDVESGRIDQADVPWKSK